MHLTIFIDYTNQPGLINCHSESLWLTKQNEGSFCAGENSLFNSSSFFACFNSPSEMRVSGSQFASNALPQLLSNILSEQTSFQRICHIVTNYCMALMCILKQLQRFETSSVVSFPYYNALIKAEFNLLVVCTSGTLGHGLIRAKINLNASSRNIHLRIGDSERSQVRVIFGGK